MRYGPGGQLIALIAKPPATGDQVTTYVYGVTLTDSDLASNDLLAAEIYSDAASATDRITYGYNRQGQRTLLQGQNGSVHEYEHDALGRQTADKVTTLAAGVDGAAPRALRRGEPQHHIPGAVCVCRWRGEYDPSHQQDLP